MCRRTPSLHRPVQPLNFLRVFIFLASSLLAPSSLVQAEVVDAPAEIVEAIEAAMTAYETPGLSVAVIDQGALTWARGFGVCQEGDERPVTVETLFQAASISKPVSAACALRFVDQGKLTLDDDINDRLVSWKLPPSEKAAGRKITLRWLLCHGGGITVHGFRGYAPGEAVPSLLQILDGQPPANSKAIRVDLRPGNVFRYSGGGYTILQQLLIDVAGQPFAEIMRTNVLEAVGMRQSTFLQPLPEERRSEAATGHRRGRVPIDGKYHTYPELAAAGLWTTPSDLARFAIAVQDEVTGRSTSLFSESLAQEMLRPQVKPHIGLGFFLAGKGASERFSHGGGNEGFRCELLAYRTTGDGAVVMTNSDTGGRAAAAVLKAIGDFYRWPK